MPGLFAPSVLGQGVSWRFSARPHMGAVRRYNNTRLAPRRGRVPQARVAPPVATSTRCQPFAVNFLTQALDHHSDARLDFNKGCSNRNWS